MGVRKLLLGVAILGGAVLTGLLLASLLLKQECPDCSGTTRFLAENPAQCVDGPAILDCPRCGDSGRVSLLNGRAGLAPDPVMAALMSNSNRETWRMKNVRSLLQARLRESRLTMADAHWDSTVGAFGKSRFLRQGGKTYVLLALMNGEWIVPEDAPARLFLFDARGTLLDGVSVRARGGASVPDATWTGSCVRISLLNWNNKPCESVEVDHAGRLWSDTPAVPDGKLDQLEWEVFLRAGLLQVVDAGGKSIAD